MSLQPLSKQTNLTANSEACADQVLDTMLSIHKFLHTDMRQRKPPDLSIPQFRVLAFLAHHKNASLSELAEHVGVTLPTMSRAIDGLVSRKLVKRRTDVADRRRLTLRLTQSGEEMFEVASKGVRSRVAECLAKLPPGDQQIITKAMQLIRTVFESGDTSCRMSQALIKKGKHQ